MPCQCSKMGSIINTVALSSSSSKPSPETQSTPPSALHLNKVKNSFTHTLKSQICHQQFSCLAVELKRQRNAPRINSGNMLEQMELGDLEKPERSFHVIFQGVTSLIYLAMLLPQFPHESNKGSKYTQLKIASRLYL